MEKLKEELAGLIERLENADELRTGLDELVSFFPFNEFEYVISHLLAAKKLSIDEYYQMRTEYIARNSRNNRHLDLFEMSSRLFGGWAESYIETLVPALKRPNKKEEQNFSNEYDFILPPAIRIEVKSSRATDSKSKLPLSQKALSSDSEKNFDMNFQQIKPRFCDVFIFMAIWRNVIKFWVITSFEIENNRYYSDKQHRGNVGEGQLHFKHNNIDKFNGFLVEPNKIETAIKAAFEREKKYRKK